MPNVTIPEFRKVFVVTSSNKSVMERLERFMALLHFNSSFGHSSFFGMYLDGDGSEKVQIEGLPKELAYEVDAIGGVGYTVELAENDRYTGLMADRNRKAKWYTGKAANLYKEGKVVRTIPGMDYDEIERLEKEDPKG